MSSDLRYDEHVVLAPRTSLELGGPARYLIDADDVTTVRDALMWADVRKAPITILGGGSNVVVADDGLDGLVVCMRQRGIDVEDVGDEVLLRVAAGEPWDDVVAFAVAEDLAGIECLSGIPGSTGATPIQNVGAYGQEVADTVRRVRVIDRAASRVVDMTPAQCEFAYRDSAFKRHPTRWIVIEVTFALRRHGEPAQRYPELARALALRTSKPDLREVRSTVLSLRRAKSMVIDPSDENRRSAGSFFTNPIVASQEADRVARLAVDLGLVAKEEEVPRFPVGTGSTKLSAGWLIEKAGIAKGTRRGAVGISTRHALAIVHHGGGTSAELVAFALEVRSAVWGRFGVSLTPEPVFLGFGASPFDAAVSL